VIGLFKLALLINLQGELSTIYISFFYQKLNESEW
jgi:hypothetical protein